MFGVVIFQSSVYLVDLYSASWDVRQVQASLVVWGSGANLCGNTMNLIILFIIYLYML